MPGDDLSSAKTLEHLALDRMNAPVSDGLQENLALGRFWGNLTPEERTGIARAIGANHDELQSAGLPDAVFHYDQTGNCDCINFTQHQNWFEQFTHQKPRHVKVANDGDVGIWVSSS